MRIDDLGMMRYLSRSKAMNGDYAAANSIATAMTTLFLHFETVMTSWTAIAESTAIIKLIYLT